MKTLAAWILTAYLLGALSASGASTQTLDLTQIRQYKIAFVRDGSIWIANGDGSGQKRIIEHGCAPAWSPDRKRIAFARHGNIWVADADGTHLKQLTHLWALEHEADELYNIEISWRPGTNQITFSRFDELIIHRKGVEGLTRSSSYESDCVDTTSIFDVDVDGKTRARFDAYDYAGETHFLSHTSPSWSPHGDRLFFVRDGDIWSSERVSAEMNMRPGWDVSRLYAVAMYDEAEYRADTSNWTACHISVSADEKLIAYGYGRSPYDCELRLLEIKKSRSGKIDVGQDRLLLPPYTTAMWPSFSPKGELLAYHSPGDKGKYDIWVARIDDGSRVRLIENGEEPAW